MKDKIINILAAVTAAILWVTVFGKFIDTLKGFGSLLRPRSIDYFSALILAPIWEEYIFRHIPLKWVSSFNNKDYTWAVMVITSVIFGIVHGGPSHIFIQGVVGLVSAWLYFKNDKSYWSCVVYHMSYNAYVMFS
jgi:membrane protease YdiL (CAAX protease family)